MLQDIREKNPIVHCITNHVVSNFQANGLLALGASPIMGEAPEEAANLAALADALSLNIGTLHQSSLTSMLLAGKAANDKGIPVVLDPVGAGATPFRAGAVRKILEEVNVTVLRCNAGELAAVMGVDWQSKGVDAGTGNSDISDLARSAAKKLGLIVAVTGAIDIVTDGEQLVEIPYGDPIMTAVTGTGCLLSSVVASFLAVHPNNEVAATVSAMQYYAIAGKRASMDAKLPGDFQRAFLNELNSVQDMDIKKTIQIQEGTR